MPPHLYHNRVCYKWCLTIKNEDGCRLLQECCLKRVDQKSKEHREDARGGERRRAEERGREDEGREEHETYFVLLLVLHICFASHMFFKVNLRWSGAKRSGRLEGWVGVRKSSKRRVRQRRSTATETQGVMAAAIAAAAGTIF